MDANQGKELEASTCIWSVHAHALHVHRPPTTRCVQLRAMSFRRLDLPRVADVEPGKEADQSMDWPEDTAARPCHEAHDAEGP